MNIHNLFEDALHRAAARPALIAGIGKKRRTVTFEQLDQYVDGVVATLNKRGLRAGDRVLLAVPISIDTYIVMLALLKGGMVIMHIDPAHGLAKVAQVLKAWPPAAIVASKPILMFGLLFRPIQELRLGYSAIRLQSLLLTCHRHRARFGKTLRRWWPFARCDDAVQ